MSFGSDGFAAEVGADGREAADAEGAGAAAVESGAREESPQPSIASAKVAIERYAERLIMFLPLQLTEASSRPFAKSSETDRETMHSRLDTIRSQTIRPLHGCEPGRPCRPARARQDSKKVRAPENIVLLHRNEFGRRCDRRRPRMSSSGRHSA